MENALGIQIPFSTIVNIALLLFMIAYLLFSSSLLYHWYTYSTDNKITRRATIVYLLASGICVSLFIISYFGVV